MYPTIKSILCLILRKLNNKLTATLSGSKTSTWIKDGGPNYLRHIMGDEWSISFALVLILNPINIDLGMFSYKYVCL